MSTDPSGLSPAELADVERRFEHFDHHTATTYEAGDPATPPDIVRTQELAARALAERSDRHR